MSACGGDFSSSAEETGNYCRVSRSGNTITQVMQETQFDMVLRGEVTATFTNTLFTAHSTMDATNIEKYGFSLEDMCKEDPEYTSCEAGVDYFDATQSEEINLSDEQKEAAIQQYINKLQSNCDELDEKYDNKNKTVSTNYPITSCQPTLQNGVLTVSMSGENFNNTTTIYNDNGLFYNSEVYVGFSQEFVDNYYQHILSEENYSNIERNGNTFTYWEIGANYLGHEATIEEYYKAAQGSCSALLSGDITIEEMFFD